MAPVPFTFVAHGQHNSGRLTSSLFHSVQSSRFLWVSGGFLERRIPGGTPRQMDNHGKQPSRVVYLGFRLNQYKYVVSLLKPVKRGVPQERLMLVLGHHVSGASGKRRLLHPLCFSRGRCPKNPYL